MKKPLVIFVLIISSIFLSSCYHNTLHTFNQTSLHRKLNKSGFTPELPTELPFKIKSTNLTETPQPNNKVFTVDFHGTKGEYMSLQMINGGKVHYSDNLKREKVKIGNQNGSYVKNDQGAMMLNWENNNIHYDLTYYSKQSKKEISKSDLIQTAESFK